MEIVIALVVVIIIAQLISGSKKGGNGIFHTVDTSDDGWITSQSFGFDDSSCDCDSGCDCGTD